MTESAEISVGAATLQEVLPVMQLEREIATAPHWGEYVYRDIVNGAGGAVRRCLYVARRGNEAVGFAVARVFEGSGEIESLAVRETERRRGLGRRLLEAVLGWCGEQGARAIELEVRVSSLGAQRLYAECGFVEAGLRTGYYDDPREDAVIMRLDCENGMRRTVPSG